MTRKNLGKKRGKKKPLFSSSHKRDAKKTSFFRRLARISLIIGIWALLCLAAVILWYAYDLPSVDSLEVGERRPSYVFLTANHEEIAHYGDLTGESIQLQDIPPYVVEAIISMEDRHFFAHPGIDWGGILRAFWTNVRAGGIVQGGSTLTQQIAKNLFLTNDRSFRRKVQEMILSFWLEYHFSKEQLLTIYLNRVYLGTGTYGVDAASQEYFGKPVRSISLPEATVLAAVLKAPSRLAPSRNPEKVKERAKLVAKRMVDEGYIPAYQLPQLLKEIGGLHFDQTSRNHHVRYFTDWVMDQLPDLVDMKQDLLIVTTLDLFLQKKAWEAVQGVLETAKEKDHVEEAAIVALDYDGALKAMVGGHHYLDTIFNRATQAKRQVGSTFKIFVYLAALEAGISPETLFQDNPPSYPNWDPRNYGWRPRGEISMEDGFVYSVNSVAIRVAEATGLQKVIDMARRLGLSEAMPYNLTLALGSSSSSLLELTNAYTIMVNGGYLTAPFGILEILTSEGKSLYKFVPSLGRQVIDTLTLQKMHTLLRQAVERGTAKRANIPGVTLGGKTGTTQKHRDAWFLGSTSEIVAGVWVGNDDERPMKRVTGALYPVQIWRKVMEGYYKEAGAYRGEDKTLSGKEGNANPAEKE